MKPTNDRTSTLDATRTLLVSVVSGEIGHEPATNQRRYRQDCIRMDGSSASDEEDAVRAAWKVLKLDQLPPVLEDAGDPGDDPPCTLRTYVSEILERELMDYEPCIIDRVDYFGIDVAKLPIPEAAILHLKSCDDCIEVTNNYFANRVVDRCRQNCPDARSIERFMQGEYLAGVEDHILLCHSCMAVYEVLKSGAYEIEQCCDPNRQGYLPHSSSNKRRDMLNYPNELDRTDMSGAYSTSIYDDGQIRMSSNAWFVNASLNSERNGVERDCPSACTAPMDHYEG